MATDQDAARDRVLAARAAFDQEYQTLQSSTRDAVDIPAKIRRNPEKAVAVAGGALFLLLRGPQAVVRGTRRLMFGKPAPLPKSMLPDEIEETLGKMGNDGDRVRGALERDFARYALRAQTQRRRELLALSIPFLRPVIARGAKAGMDWLNTPGRMDAFRAETEAAAQDREAAERARASVRKAMKDA